MGENTTAITVNSLSFLYSLFNNARGEKERKLKKAAKRARESQEFYRKARAVCLEISSLPALPIDAM